MIRDTVSRELIMPACSRMVVQFFLLSVLFPACSFAQSVSFASPQLYGVGQNPDAVAAADFNHDGKQDLAVANSGGDGGTVSILLGNGDGTFQPARDFPSGFEPFSVKTADFNHDGKLDLAIANGNNNTVSILLGNGDGTFQARQTIAVANSPFALALGDFNRDGNVDIVTANYSFYVSPGAVTVLLGNGDGTFQPPVSYPAGQHPYYVVVGKFKRNHVEDLAVIDYDLHLVNILIGRGDGTFSTPVSYPVGMNPFAVVVEDFNGDHALDLATSNWGDGTGSVLLGNGNGTFQNAVSFPAGQSPEYFAAGDFNGDHKPDLAVPLYGGGTNQVAVLLNTTP